MSALKRKRDQSLNSAELKKPKVNGCIASFFGAPKASLSVSPASTAKFDKQKWVDGLRPEQKELLKLEIETLDESWLAHLKDDIASDDFLNLKRFLDRETSAGRKWFPPKEDVYSWSRHTPFNNVKVVIVGQDPYHNVNQAHGMAFSVRPPTPAPPSLRNMYIALKNDYPEFVAPPKNGGLLIPWADRGVLMLNTCLTVRAHEANSHSNRGWERFTQKVIDLVAQKRTRGVVFMAWGTPAGKRVQKVDKQRHLVLQSVHPSPLSASRGFFDCGHFRKANEWLVSRYGDDGEVDWALVAGTSTKRRATPPAETTMLSSSEIESTSDKPPTTTLATTEKASELDTDLQAKNHSQEKLSSEATDGEKDADDADDEALEEALALAEDEAKK